MDNISTLKSVKLRLMKKGINGYCDKDQFSDLQPKRT